MKDLRRMEKKDETDDAYGGDFSVGKEVLLSIFFDTLGH